MCREAWGFESPSEHHEEGSRNLADFIMADWRERVPSLGDKTSREARGATPKGFDEGSIATVDGQCQTSV